MDLYASRKQELRDERGPYTRERAARHFARYLEGAGTDYLRELAYHDRKALHNLKYFTWVEQQGKTVRGAGGAVGAGLLDGGLRRRSPSGTGRSSSSTNAPGCSSSSPDPTAIRDTCRRRPQNARPRAGDGPSVTPDPRAGSPARTE